jgi:hypothetical protein
MQHLGTVLTPYGAHSPYGWYAEVAQTRGGDWGKYLPQPRGYPLIDRFFNTRGEVGFFYDTQLGHMRTRGFFDRFRRRPLNGLGDMIPTDAELAINTSCYTPVHSGWVKAKEGFIPNPWRFGWNPAGQYGPKTSLTGLGDMPPQQTAADVIAVMSAHNQRMFNLAIVSTAAVSISAMFTLWTRWKRLKLERARRRG